MAKHKKEQEQYLSRQLNFLEELMDRGENVTEEYEEVKHEIESINEQKVKGHLIRSKAKWIEDGEKCTKYFLQLESRNFKTKYIKTLKDENKTISDHKKILEAQEKFYGELYTAPNDSNEEYNDVNCLFNEKSDCLSESDKQSCDIDISVEECGKSLLALSNNKSPGSDGFTTEFYKFFWPDIRSLVFNAFNFSFESGILSNNQREAVLTLLPKPNKDLRLLKNWRPISLLNTDYKILTKLLANRLQKVINNVVSEDQSGYIKGRFIGENIRTVLDVIEYFSQRTNPGILLFLDFEQAFDTVSWKFLFKTLDYFNFGDNFKRWISIIYNKPRATVLNNGHATNFFSISRDIRQGCPISALLFILVAEILAINIKMSKDITGITINKKEIFISQLADDTTLFVKDTKSLEKVFNILDKFHKCAGLKLNKNKTEGLILGKHNVDLSKYDIRTPDTIKYLGIIISNKINDIEIVNYNDKNHTNKK